MIFLKLWVLSFIIKSFILAFSYNKKKATQLEVNLITAYIFRNIIIIAILMFLELWGII